VRRLVLFVAVAWAVLAPSAAEPARAAGDWAWPVVGPVIRGFDPPASTFGSGHRGIDIAAGVGFPVRAPAAGKVSFAGPVGGRLFLTIDHGAGLESTYSWLDALIARRGDPVSRGQLIGRSGSGHPGAGVPHLHFGVKLLDVYVDPLDYLGPAEVWRFIRLAPLDGA
jgi:murein DD-endopeptidase MepM/ murein hydrolase activator NlpD